MALPVEYDPRAMSEIRAARRRYERVSAALGARFITAFDVAVTLASTTPTVCSPHLDGTRISRVRKFPYWVVFIEEPNRILVLALMHSARRSGYWRRRLP